MGHVAEVVPYEVVRKKWVVRCHVPGCDFPDTVKEQKRDAEQLAEEHEEDTR